MLETSMKLTRATKEAGDLLMKNIFDADAIKNMSAENLELIKSYIKLVELSNEYCIKTAETMNEINNKLDLLLKLKEIESK